MLTTKTHKKPTLLARRSEQGAMLPRARRGKMRLQGFALILTLMMMVLLVTVALGLLSLSSITLRSSSHEANVRIARANAKMALMIALGELQKQAGPDQRITATADIGGAALGVKLPNGAAPQNNKSIAGVDKGLSAVQPGSRYWTGVWTNSNTTNAATEIYTKTPSPILVKWLISGNEALSGNNMLNPSLGSVAVNSSGEVGKDAVLLVGEYTVGSPSPETLQNYVSAPLVNISSGQSGSAKTSGRYGWWVGDEGVKSRLNQSSEEAPNAVVNYQTLGADRRGWETVQGCEQFPTPGPNSVGTLGKVVSNSQATQLASTMTRSSNVVSRVFHSATTDSNGVIADPLAGGLRLDLSSYLANLPASQVPGVDWSPMAGRNVIPTTITGTAMKGPKWDRLKEFSELFKNKVNGDTLTTEAPSSSSPYGIAPLIFDLRILLGGKVIPTTAPSYKIYPVGKVSIALANPYPYKLKWSTPLDLEIKYDPSPLTLGKAGYAPSRIYSSKGEGSLAYFSKIGTNEPAVFNNALFRIPAGELPPGEARAYTMTNQLLRTQAQANSQAVLTMGDYASSGATDLEKSIQLETTPVYAANDRVDVREASNTSLVSAELRVGGSTTQILRRIERIELDNGYFVPTQRDVIAPTAGSTPKAFGLMLYAFQLSQPGMDYENLLPETAHLGLRNSTLRTFTDFNLQATRFRKTITAYTPPPYFMESSNSRALVADDGAVGLGFTRNLGLSQLAWGRSSAGSTKKTVLFSFPESMISLAQLQHADLTADDQDVSIGHQPGNAVGNSYASPYLMRELTIQTRSDWTLHGTDTKGESRKYYDLSYLLNAALWDTCFFSSIPRAGSPVPMNRAIVKINPMDASPDLRDGTKAASHLFIEGALNVNGTEKDAWKALLAGTKFRGHTADGGASSDDALYARSLEQLSPSKAKPTGVGEDSFSGFRRLTDAQVDAVAEEITRQVRLRGPFVSLSHFMNRALVPLATNKELGRSGALQSALDLASVNVSPDLGKSAFDTGLKPDKDKVNLQSDSGSVNPRADLPGSDPGLSGDDWAKSSRDDNPCTVASIAADRQILNSTGDPAKSSTYSLEQGSRSSGIPGWLTQADLLQVIGPSLAVRSDTFRIRSYGEAVDAQGKTTARAWCEAVVQRLPLYVDPSDPATDRGGELSSVNRTFGRQFQFVSFRWLSPNEI